MTDSVLFLIPARGGSKGLPGKNLRLLAGVPLVAWAIRTAVAAAKMLPGVGHRVVCSTEDPRIARIAKEWGAEVPFVRPIELAGDAVDATEVAVHALDWHAARGQHFRALALVQPSSPLSRPADLAAAVRLFLSSAGEPVVSVSPAPHAAWSYRLERGRLQTFGPGAAEIARRQDAGDVVVLNGAVFVSDPEALRHTRQFVELGSTRASVMPAERGVDVDTLADLQHCEALLTGPTSPIDVGGRLVGPGAPCFVIAEAGVNHNGEPAVAHQLVDAAANAGADAIKFQTFDPEQLAAADAPRAEYQKASGGAGTSQREMLARLVLPRAAHRELAEHSLRRGLLFLSSPFDHASADFLEELGVPAFKIPSGEITNHPLLEHIARKGRPMLVSTGMCGMVEVASGLDVIREAREVPVALLHCVSNYPAAPRDANLRAIGSLARAFGVPAGWSDHTPGTEVALAAAALGAALIEKHLTLDRELPGPDQRASLEPDEFRRLVAGIRVIESSLGDGQKEPRPGEAAIAAVARKSLHWRSDVPLGASVRADQLVALRPGTGLAPPQLRDLVGRRLRRAAAAGTLVSEEDFEP